MYQHSSFPYNPAKLTLARKFEAVHITTVASRRIIPMVWRHTPPRSCFWLGWLVLSGGLWEEDESVDLLRASVSSACKFGTGKTKSSAGTVCIGPLMVATGFPGLDNLLYGGTFAPSALLPLLHRFVPYLVSCEGVIAHQAWLPVIICDTCQMRCGSLAVSRWTFVRGRSSGILSCLMHTYVPRFGFQYLEDPAGLKHTICVIV